MTMFFFLSFISFNYSVFDYNVPMFVLSCCCYKVNYLGDVHFLIINVFLKPYLFSYSIAAVIKLI